MKHISQYCDKVKQFSFNEKIVVVLYSVFTIFLQWLPKNPINTHLLFNDLRKQGIKFTRRGSQTIIHWVENQVPLIISIKRDSSDALVFRQIFMEKEYQPIVDLFLRKNIPLKTMIDAGANIGLASLYICNAFPMAKIFALEPNKGTFERLVNNIEMNRIDLIHAENKGLWSCDTFLAGDRSFRDKKDWSFRLKESRSGSKNNFQVKGISTLLKEYHWDGIDFLKIDIEGPFFNLSKL